MSTAIKEADVREFPRPVESQEKPAAGQLFFNREFSLLEFHARVLEEALNLRNPLLERLKFLAIFSSNLDEFFMIRVSGLKEELGHVTSPSPDGLTPEQQLERVREKILPLVEQQSKCLHEDVLPKLGEAGIEIAPYASLSHYEKQSVDEYFTEKVFPIVTPLAVDPSHPFPYISPLSLNIGLMVTAPEGKAQAFGNKHFEPRFVRIKVPSLVPRLVPVGFSGSKFILLEDLIEANIESLFPGMEPGECHRFRVTRDADIEIRDEEAQDLLSLIQAELRQRRFGTPVRLEVSKDMPEEMLQYLTESLGLQESDVYKIDGALAIQELMSIYDVDRPDLKDEPFVQSVPEWCSDPKKIFEAISENDRLVHHPYDSYDCVTEFINQAVADEDVLAIKICLYRTGPDSPIPPALI